METINKTSWERIGAIPVDSGTLMISDPCYAVENVTGHGHNSNAWREFCEMMAQNKIDDEGHMAVKFGHVITGFGGDGFYPVYVKRDELGNVTELRVKFA